jgi:hypothetical protein
MQRGAYTREAAHVGPARRSAGAGRRGRRRAGRSGGRRRAMIGALLTALTVCGSAAARSAGEPGAGRANTGAQDAASPPPTIQPRHGRSFTPTLGDWEGTAGGFAASFELQFDTKLRPRPGIPQYGVAHLVLLKPATCPPNPSSHSEAIFSTNFPTEIGRFGSLGLAGLGLVGSVTGGRSVTLAEPYTVGSCHGTLTWHLHPARRPLVDDGLWTARFGDGEQSSFTVQGQGRLATAIQLPRSLGRCNGLQGAVDLFIGAAGRASITTSGVTLGLRFQRQTGSGTLRAPGCATSSVRLTLMSGGG